MISGPNMAVERGSLTAALLPYIWPAGGVGLATAVIVLGRPFDTAQASLLYLPVVIVCAMRFGFGPAILGAVLSFLCWDWFFLPPYHALTLSNPKDLTSLVVFLVAASITARLAAQARDQTTEARARVRDITTLFEASDAMSHEVSAPQALATLAHQLQSLCDATGLMIFRRSEDGARLRLVSEARNKEAMPEPVTQIVERMAHAAFEYDQTIGLSDVPWLWAKAMSESYAAESEIDPRSLGVYISLHAADKIVGVLHVSTRRDGKPFTPLQERLIQTLANHAAAVIARELLSAQAAQAKALEEADALKDALLSLVSHEMRTPLAAIKASASGLLQPDAAWNDRARHEALVSIDTETDRLSNIVSNLLDLSRLEAGSWKPVRDWCDVSDVADTALQRLSISDAERVRVSIAAGIPLIRIDYVQIALVMENLLQNAVKYTPAGTPIDLSVTAEYNGIDEAAKGIAVRVRDYGGGILADEADQLFSRFFRSVRHRDGTVHGTGIGLALCKAVVEAHDGTIDAGNAPGGEPSGAVFMMHLPIM